MIPLTVFNAIIIGLRSPLAVFIAAALGTLGAHALFYLLLGVGKRARRQKMEEEEAERTAIVPVLKAENSDFRRANARLAQENAELRDLVEEDDNHGRNWRARVHATIGKETGG